MDDPENACGAVLAHSRVDSSTDLLHFLLEAMPVDRIVIPSLPDYFKGKLERTSSAAGLTVLESRFRGTSVRAERSLSQLDHPQSNQFSLEQGFQMGRSNPELRQSGSRDVIETASIIVFVARK